MQKITEKKWNLPENTWSEWDQNAFYWNLSEFDSNGIKHKV